ncbi:low affinity immunoglobulin epsilon Fc receptor isoform X1 [Magallana gigas]|uniref:low affinity immunoglobulin epsilon Fc receptor isoform X1 n=1 Tax=Magallana gigas TaxID=29159 RepID=UPI00148A1A92|nr:CD209 antigen-like protein D isoform X2 [Crassostrea gigas]
MENLSTVVLLACLYFPFSEAASCVHGWVTFRDKCYFFGKTKETWYAASALCQSFGSKLAEPVTQEEVVFLGRETMQIGNNGDYFIGIHDIFLEGEWMYAYSRKPVTLTMPWASGNPDNYHEEDCVEIDSSPQFHGMWGDALCSYPLYYICEYDSSEYIQAPAVIG